MDATTFDGISRNLSAVSTRRGFTRLLGGAAVLGTVFGVGEDSQARGKRNGKGREQVSAQGKGKKKITICYQNQTRTVKKKGYQNKYPGATKGACSTGGNPGGGGGQPQPVVCSRWIISGGPNQTDNIVADDDLGIYNLSQGGKGIISEFDGKASVISPPHFDARVGDQLRIYGYDRGGCRSLSPLWLHCSATGRKRQLFQGYSGVNCTYPTGGFVEEFREVWV